MNNKLVDALEKIKAIGDKPENIGGLSDLAGYEMLSIARAALSSPVKQKFRDAETGFEEMWKGHPGYKGYADKEQYARDFYYAGIELVLSQQKPSSHVDDGWIEIKEGCEMPKADSFITVRNIYGHYSTYMTDKDDLIFSGPVAKQIAPEVTHWQYVKEPY